MTTNCLKQNLQDGRINRIRLVVDHSAGSDLHRGVLDSSDWKTLFFCF